MFKPLLIPLFALLLCSITMSPKSNFPKTPLSCGAKAPMWKGINQDGKEVKLSEVLKTTKKLILYFYPKNNTPICTYQAKHLRDHYEKLQKAGYTVIGVSTDTVDSHKKFCQKHQLPFQLISDTDHSIHLLYDTWQTINILGIFKLPNPQRITFVINQSGIIEKVIRGTKVWAQVKHVLTPEELNATN